MLFHHLDLDDKRRIQELRKKGINSKSRHLRSGQPLLWREKDLIHGKVVDTLVMVLSTRGCSWSEKGNCSMCGYFVDSGSETPVPSQFENGLSQRKQETMLKVYTSGSFLDPLEISEALQETILSSAGEHFDRVLIEARPEFVTKERMKTLADHADLEIAMGLESASDEVLTHSINKGFLLKHYERAAHLLQSLNIPLRTYLLLKPPFMTEAGAIRDVTSSISLIQDLTETISINPMNVQRFTLVEHLFRKDAYRSPYLWSLLEVLRTPTQARLMSSPSGGGTRRGVHNCGKCDKEILNRISEFSLTQDPEVLEYDCECKDEWKDMLILEDAIQTSLRAD